MVVRRRARPHTCNGYRQMTHTLRIGRCVAALALMALLALPVQAKGVIRAEAAAQRDRMLTWAPEGTWGVLVLDVEALLESPLAPGRWAPHGARPRKSPGFAVFFLTRAGDPPEQSWCGAVWSKDYRDVNALAEVFGEPTAAAERSAYVTEEGVYMVVTPEGVMLVGADKEAAFGLNALRQSTERAGLPEELSDLLAPVKRGGLRLAFVLTDEMRAAGLPPTLRSGLIGAAPAKGEDAGDASVPEYLSGMEHGVIDLRMTDGVALGATIRLADEGAAAAAADAVSARLAPGEQLLDALDGGIDPDDPMASLLLPLYEAEGIIRKGTTFSADGADLRAAFSLTEDEILDSAVSGWPLHPLWMAASRIHRDKPLPLP